MLPVPQTSERPSDRSKSRKVYGEALREWNRQRRSHQLHWTALNQASLVVAVFGLTARRRHSQMAAVPVMTQMSGPESPKTRYPDYRRPPVVERVLTVASEMSEEIYLSRLDSWEQIVQPEFPIREPVSEWTVKMDPKNIQRVLDPSLSELKIVPRFSKQPSSKGFDWSLRFPRGQLTVNMHSNPNSPRRFQDLSAEFQRWLPQWMQHFEVDYLQTIALHYVNVLNRESVQAFMTGPTIIAVDKILTIFVHIPGTQRSLIPPINCMVNMSLDSRQPANLAIHLLDGPDPQPSLRLDLGVRVSLNPQTPMEVVFEWLEWCHYRILERFDVVFTDEAKKSFEPIPI